MYNPRDYMRKKRQVKSQRMTIWLLVILLVALVALCIRQDDEIQEKRKQLRQSWNTEDSLQRQIKKMEAEQWNVD
jgi:cell division protein FtsB